MLAQVYIKNYAIIDSIELDWNKGMTAITGETGAGKSIMIGALQFVLGARSDSKVLRNPEEKCIVEVKFNQLEDKKSDLVQFDFLDDKDEIIIRREILPNGRSRSFINDSPVSVAELNSLSPFLISIHQQFDHLDILEENFQMEILDLYVDQIENLKEYKLLFKHYKSLIQEKKQLENDQNKSNEEKDYIEFQLEELKLANIQAFEYKQIEADLSIALKAEEIINAVSGTTELIEADNGIIEKIQDIHQLLKSIQNIPSINEVSERIQSIRMEVKDILSTLQRIGDKTEFDPGKIVLLQNRFDLLTRLLKKHRAQSDEDLIEIRESLSAKVKSFSSQEKELAEKEKQIQIAHQELNKLAIKISMHRNSKAIELEPEIIKLLKLLGMEFAQFKINLSKSNELKSNGIDLIEFLFSANKGSEPKPIKNQASGGELSRLNLALKSIISKKINLPSMIFDEIDTGVSGQIALQMGNILREMSKDHQLITITHSPQVASRAQQHYYVYKDSSTKITNTRFKKLDSKERMIELAKMLSGDPPSASALRNANELISSAN